MLVRNNETYYKNAYATGGAQASIVNFWTYQVFGKPNDVSTGNDDAMKRTNCILHSENNRSNKATTIHETKTYVSIHTKYVYIIQNKKGAKIRLHVAPFQCNIRYKNVACSI